MKNENINLITDEMSQNIVKTAEKIVTLQGSGGLTVRRILQELNITNRVFYNRFHNIDEVLEIVYNNTIMKVRKSLEMQYDGKQDFFEFVTDLVANALVKSYDKKKKFNQYVFENDSLSQYNHEWYIDKIKELFAYAKQQNLIKDVDVDTLSYAIWCFCRGFNADAVMRLTKDEAVRRIKYSFSILLDGLRK